MTIRKASVYREDVAGWPIFSGFEMPADMAVLTIEQRRTLDVPIREVVAGATARLQAALKEIASASDQKYWLVGLSRFGNPAGRVSSYNLVKHGMWRQFAVPGVSVPEGESTEAEIRFTDGSIGLGGSVEFDIDDMAPAVEITRLNDNAICVVTDTVAPDPLNLLTAAGVGLSPSDPSVLLRLLLGSSTHACIVRGFGNFDDVDVGVEVFASRSYLDGLEACLLPS